MGLKRMMPRDATRSLKAVTCVNNTQSSPVIIVSVSTKVQRDVSFSGAVVAAARSSSSARVATGGTPTAPTRAVLQRGSGNCQQRQSGIAEAPRALPITAMPSDRCARADG